MPLTRQRQLLAEIEAVYGTSPTPAAANALLVHDLSGPALQQTQSGRAQFTPSLSAARAARVGQRHWTLSFWMPLHGDALALSVGNVPLADPLMRACGMSATFDAVGPPTNNWTYQPESLGFESVTLVVEESASASGNAVFTELRGCRGNMKLTGTVGEIVRQEFDFQGLYNGPPANRGAGNAITPTLTSEVDPLVFVSSSFTPDFAGAVADTPDAATFGHIRSFAIDMRTKVVPSASASIATGDGIRSFEIVGRGEADDAGPSITMEVEFPQLVGAVADYPARYHNRTLTDAVATIILGTVGAPSSPVGNTTEIRLARISVDDWQWADFDGIVGMTVEGRLLNSSLAATSDDELLLRFS